MMSSSDCPSYRPPRTPVLQTDRESAPRGGSSRGGSAFACSARTAPRGERGGSISGRLRRSESVQPRRASSENRQWGTRTVLEHEDRRVDPRSRYRCRVVDDAPAGTGSMCRPLAERRARRRVAPSHAASPANRRAVASDRTAVAPPRGQRLGVRRDAGERTEVRTGHTTPPSRDRAGSNRARCAVRRKRRADECEKITGAC